MKTCAYCGRDNPDDALHCSGCGTDNFVAVPSERASKDGAEKKSDAGKRSSLVTGGNITKFIGGLICVVLGVGMHIQPIASDTFAPSNIYSEPHTVHNSAGQMSIFGTGLALLGLGLICSIFYRSPK
jgi:hypothetical protein